jgi:hypothetical protein
MIWKLTQETHTREGHAMSHRENDAQRELQHEQDLEEQWDRIRILQNRVTFLGRPMNAHLKSGFEQGLIEWREEIREDIEDLMFHHMRDRIAPKRLKFSY